MVALVMDYHILKSFLIIMGTRISSFRRSCSRLLQMFSFSKTIIAIFSQYLKTTIWPTRNNVRLLSWEKKESIFVKWSRPYSKKMFSIVYCLPESALSTFCGDTLQGLVHTTLPSANERVHFCLRKHFSLNSSANRRCWSSHNLAWTQRQQGILATGKVSGASLQSRSTPLRC